MSFLEIVGLITLLCIAARVAGEILCRWDAARPLKRWDMDSEEYDRAVQAILKGADGKPSR